MPRGKAAQVQGKGQSQLAAAAKLYSEGGGAGSKAAPTGGGGDDDEEGSGSGDSEYATPAEEPLRPSQAMDHVLQEMARANKLRRQQKRMALESGYNAAMAKLVREECERGGWSEKGVEEERRRMEGWVERVREGLARREALEGRILGVLKDWEEGVGRFLEEVEGGFPMGGEGEEGEEEEDGEDGDGEGDGEGEDEEMDEEDRAGSDDGEDDDDDDGDEEWDE
ncbi:hypothetical protein DFH27DRAFT_550910 [Peziza echinospora]|nr:hypothetical protein DFH27DRAFT_550910 [Peziza echinospora]